MANNRNENSHQMNMLTLEQTAYSIHQMNLILNIKKKISK